MVSRWYKRLFHVVLSLLILVLLSPIILLKGSGLFYPSHIEEKSKTTLNQEQVFEVDVSLNQADLVTLLNDRSTHMTYPFHVQNKETTFELVYPISYLGMTTEARVSLQPAHTTEGDLILTLKEAALGRIELPNRLILQLLNETPIKQYMTIQPSDEQIMITSEQLSEWIGYRIKMIEMNQNQQTYQLKCWLPRTILTQSEVTTH
ncbi:DUF2140 family protein [Atopobacter phocae]|uniref:DUF2140 family protein n=1 Tax=Atopobacter phocae TaxID=136492 RepID=UPI00046EA425|nr:DUF2140 family protein [Atopobacter phocae]